MSLADSKKQKLLIQDLLSSPEVYTRTAGILKPSYFDNEAYAKVVHFIHSYYAKYNATPSVEQVNAEFDSDFEQTKRLPKDRVQYSCDEIEKFCKEVAVREAILNSLDDISNHEMAKVLARITEAVNISLQKDMGIDVFDDPENRLTSLIENYTPIPTGIKGIDDPLNGGLIRGQLTLFSANSGGGKSIMMNNVGNNFTLLRNLHVVLISLELEDSMVFLRTASIMTGYDAANWKAHIPEIGAAIKGIGNQTQGSFIIKRLPAGSTSADIRSYLSYYEMEYQRQPDVIIVDYLDLMQPNGGVKNMGVFEQDKQKAEELREIILYYNAVGITASQQNREALTNTPSQAGIAGGISKINTVDNYISIFMSETMRLEGEMNIYFLKTRSSRGVGHMSILRYDPLNLQIKDPKEGLNVSVMPKGRKATPSVKELMGEINPPTKVTANVGELPGIDTDMLVKELPEYMFAEPEVLPEPVKPIRPMVRSSSGGESLLDLMESLRGNLI